MASTLRSLPFFNIHQWPAASWKFWHGVFWLFQIPFNFQLILIGNRRGPVNRTPFRTIQVSKRPRVTQTQATLVQGFKSELVQVASFNIIRVSTHTVDYCMGGLSNWVLWFLFIYGFQGLLLWRLTSSMYSLLQICSSLSIFAIEWATWGIIYVSKT